MSNTLVTWTTHFIEARTTALHVQLVTELYLYRLHIFDKIEVSRLDSTLSIVRHHLFVYTNFIMVSESGKISRNWEHLTVIEQHSISRGISRGFEIFRLLLRPSATAY